MFRARGFRPRCQADMDAVKPLILMAYEGRGAAMAGKYAKGLGSERRE
jgi:hypothetical protein